MVHKNECSLCIRGQFKNLLDQHNLRELELLFSCGFRSFRRLYSRSVTLVYHFHDCHECPNEMIRVFLALKFKFPAFS